MNEMTPTLPRIEIVSDGSTPRRTTDIIPPGFVEPIPGEYYDSVLPYGLKGDIMHLNILQFRESLQALEAHATLQMPLHTDILNNCIGYSVQQTGTENPLRDISEILYGSSTTRVLNPHIQNGARLYSLADYWSHVSDAITKPVQFGTTPPNLFSSYVVPLFFESDTYYPIMWQREDMGQHILRINYFGDTDFLHSLKSDDLIKYMGSQTHTLLTEAAQAVYVEKWDIDQKSVKQVLQEQSSNYPVLARLPINKINSCHAFFREVYRATNLHEAEKDFIVDEMDRFFSAEKFRIYTQSESTIPDYARLLQQAAEEASERVPRLSA